MNPPYQTKSDIKNEKTQPVWDKFIEKALSICKDDGFLASVNPSGWRSTGDIFDAAKIIKEKQIEYLEIHNEQDGIKTFGATTRYDWYVLRNSKISKNTTIVDQDGNVLEVDLRKMPFIPNAKIDRVLSFLAKKGEEKVEVVCDSSYHTQRKNIIRETRDSDFKYPVDQEGNVLEVDLRKMPFIPNAKIDRVVSFLAKKGEEKVEILHSFSSYESRKNWISETEDNVFIYPVIYSTPVVGPTIWYSNTNKNGHFGISKLILNPCRPIGFVIDEKGEYGMSQFCVGIVGNKDYLDMVAKVIKNQKTNGFSDFMEASHFTDKIFNKDVISLFRKDFWKEFI
jgi:phosphoribosyl-ATP pyrophosphohydrolase